MRNPVVTEGDRFACPVCGHSPVRLWEVVSWDEGAYAERTVSIMAMCERCETAFDELTWQHLHGATPSHAQQAWRLVGLDEPDDGGVVE